MELPAHIPVVSSTPVLILLSHIWNSNPRCLILLLCCFVWRKADFLFLFLALRILVNCYWNLLIVEWRRRHITLLPSPTTVFRKLACRKSMMACRWNSGWRFCLLRMDWVSRFQRSTRGTKRIELSSLTLPFFSFFFFWPCNLIFINIDML